MSSQNFIKKISLYKDMYTDRFVQFFDQKANDLIRNSISEAKGGLLLSKFGTIELIFLSLYCPPKSSFQSKLKELNSGTLSVASYFYPKPLLNNAGVFPLKKDIIKRFCNLVYSDCQQIDILGSYREDESNFSTELSRTKKVNLDGFLCPYLWENPWSSALRNKKVLVISPFSDSIQHQYREKRTLLFKDSSVLPEFKNLITLDAIQSNGSNASRCGFRDWFEALDFMEKEISQIDYDVALVGAGAYGMDLAAFIKRQGKIAIHLAGWTQFLFGVYGERWLRGQPKYSAFINDNWVRPSANETPLGVDKIENKAYW